MNTSALLNNTRPRLLGPATAIIAITSTAVGDGGVAGIQGGQNWQCADNARREVCRRCVVSSLEVPLPML